MTSMTGGCLCGRVRYTVTAEPLRSGLCHCRPTISSPSPNPSATPNKAARSRRSVVAQRQGWFISESAVVARTIRESQRRKTRCVRRPYLRPKNPSMASTMTTAPTIQMILFIY